MSDRPGAYSPPADALAGALETLARTMRARAAGRGGEPAFEPGEAEALAGLASAALPAAGRPLAEVMAEMDAGVFRYAARTDHPRFFAFIPSPVSPLSWLGDALTSLHNPHAGNWLQSAGASAVEQGLVRFLCDAAGLPETAGGLFVSGGSMANMTALVAARDRMLAEDERARGVAYVSTETHASVAKALRIIGVPESRVRTVGVDAAFRMDIAALDTAIAADRAAGLKPFVVVASAGTTNTGAIDPLHAAADLCAREGLWLHVDGAYGASVALCPERRVLVDGLGRADSLSWDAHKWLFQTYGCGVVLVRDRRALAESFHLKADYLRDADPEGDAVNFWDLGPELTRPARALKLWLTLQVMGLDAVGAAIGHGFGLAEAAERVLRATPGWTVVTPAQLAIVTFRYAPDGLSDDSADALNGEVARRMLAEGYAAVGATRIDGRAVLRICAIHPEATEADMAETIRRLDRHARAAQA